MKKILISLMIIVFLFLGVNCGKSNVIIDRNDISVRVKTFRSEKGYEKKSVGWCIENGVIAEGMTLDECSRAAKITFVLDVKLEEDWAIYRAGCHRIWFKNGIASTVNRLQSERFMKMLKYIKEERRKNPIWIR